MSTETVSKEKLTASAKVTEDGGKFYLKPYEKILNDRKCKWLNARSLVYAAKFGSKSLEEIRDEKKVLLNGRSLVYASKELKNDKEVVLAAVYISGEDFTHASIEIKNDKEVVLAAVKLDGLALKYASYELKADKEVALVAVKVSGSTLEYVSDELKTDKEVVLAAVKLDGSALKYASDELKADKEVVLAAVEDWKLALQYASEELKADKEVLLAAVHEDVSYEVEKNKRSGWIAALFNLIFPGAGYMYCGRWFLGIIAFVIMCIIASAKLTVMYGIFLLVLFVDGFLVVGRCKKQLIQSACQRNIEELCQELQDIERRKCVIEDKPRFL